MVVCLRREGLRGYQLSLQRFRFFLEGSVGGVCFGVDAGLFFFLERGQGRIFFWELVLVRGGGLWMFL